MPGVAAVVAGAGPHRLATHFTPVEPCPEVFAHGGAAPVRHAGRVVEKVLHSPPFVGFDDGLPLSEDELTVLVLDEVVSQGLAARFPGLLPTHVLGGVDRVARVARVPKDAEHGRG